MLKRKVEYFDGEFDQAHTPDLKSKILTLGMPGNENEEAILRTLKDHVDEGYDLLRQKRKDRKEFVVSAAWVLVFACIHLIEIVSSQQLCAMEEMIALLCLFSFIQKSKNLYWGNNTLAYKEWASHLKRVANLLDLNSNGDEFYAIAETIHMTPNEVFNRDLKRKRLELD